MGFWNIKDGYHIRLLNKALSNDCEAILELVKLYHKVNEINKGNGFCDYYPSTVIGRYLADNFDEGDAGYTDSKWHNVEGSTNIIDLLDNIQNGDTAKTKELFKLVDMDIKYNKEPLQVTPYYSFKEAIDQCRNIAERKAKEEAERKAKEEAERKAKEEAERIAKEEAERKAKEEAERKAKEEAERSSYKSLIEEFVSDTKECEYKDGIIFGKKKTIRYVATPITKHIWNAVVNKSAERDFDDDEYVPQKELGDFIKELNAHFKGRVVFEYLHKNIHANVHLQVYEKLDKNASFVFIKEDNR